MKKNIFIILLIFIIILSIIVNCQNPNEDNGDSEQNEKKSNVIGGWVYSDSNYNPINVNEEFNGTVYPYQMLLFTETEFNVGYLTDLNNGNFYYLWDFTSSGNYIYNINNDNIRFTATSSADYFEYNFNFDTLGAYINYTSSGVYLYTTSAYFRKVEGFTYQGILP